MIVPMWTRDDFLRWGPAAVVAAASGAWITNALASALTVPEMRSDPPPDVRVDVEIVATPRAMAATAVREKARAPGACEYPGTYIPCWCFQGGISVSGGCADAEEYLNNVQMFGQPRFAVQIR